MGKIKNNIFAKTISFLIIQISIVTIIFSGMTIFINANYEWYSSDYKSAKEDILQEIAWEVELEIHDRMIYNLEYSKETVGIWSEYILSDYDLPEGIGYEFELFKDLKKNIDAIKLKKNVFLADKNGVYSQELSNDVYKLTVYVADPLEMQEDVDRIYPEKLANKYKLYDSIYRYNKLAIIAFIAAVFVLVLLFVYMISSMNADPNKKDMLKKIPLDMVFCVALGAGTISCSMFDESMYGDNYELAVIGVLSGILIISFAVTSFIILFIYRVKCGKWWGNALIYFALKFIKYASHIVSKWIKVVASWLCEKIKAVIGLLSSGMRKIPLIWKTVVVLIVLVVSNLIIAVNFSWSQAAVFFWIVETVALCTAVLYAVLCMKRLQKGGQKLAEGDLNYKVNTKGLLLDFADHAVNLNKIGDGMAVAVEERIKSERFKAELITNVSHDIKTPLTSIINYVDLLNKEKSEDAKINEYIEVLDRQSKRLKKLTADLIDASKASTGNVKMEIAPCKIGLLMSQTMGEYKTKAENNGLEFVLKVPEDEIEILADGRRLWRVFDNLLNNICKYGQPGTRVYLTLDEESGKAIITYRNISKYELNISEAELMERFVRGDKARHTEGSGLGLSIARNLVELQNGSFDITIDGDLFKVTMAFDKLNL